MIPGPIRLAGPGMLPDFDLQPGTLLGAQFVSHGLKDYRSAARFVQSLPYGRNSDRSDYGLVLVELRGTCSTKHALLAALGREHESPVELRIGNYEMNEANTPGVGPVLDRYGLDCLPEAHCYLAYQGVRVDVTGDGSEDATKTFLQEETIEPASIGTYKMETHRDFMREWALRHDLDFEEVWRIREECILALSECGGS